MRRIATTLFCLLILNQLCFCQATLKESDFPVTVEYQGEPRVLLTLDQVDSVNFAYSHLIECEEYADSLESTVAGLNETVKKGVEARNQLKGIIATKDGIIEQNGIIDKKQEKAIKKANRQKKFYKFTAIILGGTTAILLILRLIPAV